MQHIVHVKFGTSRISLHIYHNLLALCYKSRTSTMKYLKLSILADVQFEIIKQGSCFLPCSFLVGQEVVQKQVWLVIHYLLTFQWELNTILNNSYLQVCNDTLTKLQNYIYLVIGCVYVVCLSLYLGACIFCVCCKSVGRQCIKIPSQLHTGIAILDLLI